MPGKNHRIGLQGEKFCPDSLEQKRPVSSGKIPAPHSPTKEHVPPNQCLQGGKEKTETPRTVARHMKHPHFHTGHLAFRPLIQKQISGKWLDFEIESDPAEKPRVRCHRCRIRMIADLAPMPSLNPRRIGCMVKMPVRQQKPVHFFPRKPGVRTLRSVKKKISPRGLQEKSVGIEGTAGKCFELIHGKMV